MTRADTHREAARTGAHRWWVLVSVCMAWFLVLVDDTAVAIAMPPIGRDLGLGLSGLEWVVNLYTLAFAVLTLSGGMLADRYGARPVFLAGLTVFTVFSLAAGLAPDGPSLIGLRAGQGAGAALMGPAALSLLLALFTGPSRALALGVWSGAGATALAGGPLLGAVLTAGFGWRSIFLLNVALGPVLWAIARRTLPAPQPAARTGPFDLAGALTSAVGLSALIFALTRATVYGWASPRLWALLTGAVAALALFVVVERRAAAPLLDLSLLRRPGFLVGNVLGLVSLAVMCSVFFFLSLYLQLATGASPIQAGLALLPLTLLSAVVAPAAGWLIPRIGPRTLIGAGLLLTATGLALLAGIAPGWGNLQLLPGLLVTGLGIGLSTTPITTATLGHVPDHLTGIASAALNASRMIGLSLGIAVMGTIVAAQWPDDLTRTTPAGTDLTTGIADGLWINAGLALAAAVLAAAAVRARARQEPAVPEDAPARPPEGRVRANPGPLQQQSSKAPADRRGEG
ncbi:MFS transporter [Streptomyces sp. DT190]|uniref:MFS transporter n=1 Tax=unclassified Streptomyces TaxID=2593676 RepID=UPI003CF003D8